jgi:DNA-binding phage protein
MTTNEACETVRAQFGAMPTSLMVAFFTIVARACKLPLECREEIFDLMRQPPDAVEEDLQDIMEATFEILEANAGYILPMKPALARGAGEVVRAWTKSVARIVKAERKKAGMSQQQLAEKSGLPQGHISKLEHAQHSPTRLTLVKIAEALGIDISVLDPAA